MFQFAFHGNRFARCTSGIALEVTNIAMGSEYSIFTVRWSDTVNAKASVCAYAVFVQHASEHTAD